MLGHGGIVSGLLLGAVGFLGLLGLRRRMMFKRGCGGGRCGSHSGGRWGHHGGTGGQDSGAWRSRAKGYADHFLGRFYSEIQAEPEQRERISHLYERLWGSLGSLQDERRDMREHFEQQWRSDSPDEAAVRARVDAGVESLRRFSQEVASALLEVHRLLSPPQRAKINAWWDRRKGKR